MNVATDCHAPGNKSHSVLWAEALLVLSWYDQRAGCPVCRAIWVRNQRTRDCNRRPWVLDWVLLTVDLRFPLVPAYFYPL